MEYIISYEIGKTIKLKRECFELVRRCKEKFSIKLNILPQCVVLTFDNKILDDNLYLDDYNININDVIIMKLIVKVYELQDSLELKCYRFLMDYDANINDLKTMYCEKSNLRDVSLLRDQLYVENEFLREGKLYFLAYAEVKVTAVDELGRTCDIYVFENELILSIKAQMIKQQFFFQNHKPILMINEKILHDEDELLEYGKSNVYFIFAGFQINVLSEGIVLIKHYVNFGTKISHLKIIISRKLDVVPNMISLMVNSQYIDNNEVVEAYKFKEGSEVIVVINLQIYIFDDNNDRTIEYFIKKKQLVKELKLELAVFFKINMGEIKLLSDKIIFNDDVTVDSLNIVNGQIIHMITEQNKIHSASITCKSMSKISVSIVNRLKSCSNNEVIRIIHIARDCSVDHLRNDISHQLKISMNSVDVYHSDVLLINGNIDKYDIKDGDMLTLRPKVLQHDTDDPFILNLVHVTDIVQPFLIGFYETIGHLKLILRELYNVNTNFIRLYFDGVELSNDAIIRDLSIVSGSRVNLVIDDKENYESRLIQLRVRNGFDEEKCDEVEHLCISDCDTVDVVMTKIDALYGLSRSDYVVSYDGDILKKNVKMSTYNIGDGAEIVISHSLLIRYTISGQDSATRVHRYPFMAADTVADLKARIGKRVNIDSESIHLSYGGCCLESEYKLTYYEIGNESSLMMVATLSGGGGLIPLDTIGASRILLTS